MTVLECFWWKHSQIPLGVNTNYDKFQADIHNMDPSKEKLTFFKSTSIPILSLWNLWSSSFQFCHKIGSRSLTCQCKRIGLPLACELQGDNKKSMEALMHVEKVLKELPYASQWNVCCWKCCQGRARSLGSVYCFPFSNGNCPCVSRKKKKCLLLAGLSCR